RQANLSVQFPSAFGWITERCRNNGSCMRVWAASLLMVFLGCVLVAQSDAIADAVSYLERGDFSSAEQTLRAELRARPNDIEALDVLGVVLDKEKKYAE